MRLKLETPSHRIGKGSFVCDPFLEPLFRILTTVGCRSFIRLREKLKSSPDVIRIR
jgi:hypothetical protein